MATYKVTCIFDAPATGWSENYYLNAADSERAVASLAGTWLERRMDLVATSELYTIRCISIRSQNVANPLDSYIQAQNADGTFPTQPNDDPEMPWSGILARATTAEGPKRSVKLLGINDSVCNGSWRTAPSNAGWVKAFNDFKAVCIRRGLAVQSINESANPLVTITSIVPGAGHVVVTTAAAHGLAEDNIMAFHRVQAGYKFKGRHRAYDVTATTFKVGPYNVGSASFVKGKMRKITYEYPVWDDLVILRKTKRPTGRPFFLLRGRN